MYNNGELGEMVNLNDVHKVSHQVFMYDYKKSGVFFLWDCDSNLYLLNDTTLSFFGNKQEFGTTNYHFTETENGYFVGLSFYLGRYFSSTTWKLTHDLYLDYHGNPTSFALKRAFTIPASCISVNEEVVEDDLSANQFLVDSPFNEDCERACVLANKLQETPCYNQPTNPAFNLQTINYANAFTLTHIIQQQRELFELSMNYSYLDVVNYKVMFSYPYRIELLDDLNVVSKVEWENYPNLFTNWFAGFPIYQRGSISTPIFYMPTSLFFAGGGLVGLTSGMAIDYILSLSGAMLNTLYALYPSSHSNIYSSPISNFTDFAISDVKTDILTLAPGGLLYVATFEPNTGYYIATFKNADKRTYQSPLKSDIGRWYVSEFPIDNLQQQFPDEYLSFDYPVYTKIVFEVSKELYNTNNTNWIYPINKGCLRPMVGIVPIRIKWKHADFMSNSPNDHYGNIPINRLVSSIGEKYESNGEWGKYNPNKWFVGKIETLTFKGQEGGVNELSILVKSGVSGEYVIPLGICVDRPVIEEILGKVVGSINDKVTQNNKHSQLHYTPMPTEKIFVEFYFLVLLNDGNLPITPSTTTFRDTLNGLFRYKVDDVYHELWWYVGSFYQPGVLVLGKPIMKHTPGANLPRTSTYRLLSHNTSTYNIKIFKGVMSVEYKVEFSGVDGYEFIGARVGTSGVPIIGIYKDKDKKTKINLPKSIEINAIPIEINEIYSQFVSGVLSYSKIASDGENVYWYFNDKLYKLNLNNQKLTTYTLNTTHLTNSELTTTPKNIRLLADFIEFVNSDVKDSIFMPPTPETKS